MERTGEIPVGRTKMGEKGVGKLSYETPPPREGESMRLVFNAQPTGTVISRQYTFQSLLIIINLAC